MVLFTCFFYNYTEITAQFAIYFDYFAKNARQLLAILQKLVKNTVTVQKNSRIRLNI
jgi:hypothetical protein